MSCRQGWTINRQHFARTTTPHGGQRHFVDGKPMKRSDWFQAMELAKEAETSKPTAGEELNNPAFTELFRLNRV